MGKGIDTGSQPVLFSPGFSNGGGAPRLRRALFIPAYLAEEAKAKAHLYGDQLDRAHAILVKWANLADQGALARKETSLDAEFLHDIFVEALGYAPVTQGHTAYQLERQFTVSGVGPADGALGNFQTDTQVPPTAVIELKSADTDLDRDRSSGRTPVQQCWDYLNGLPECPWGLLSNFVTFRLYHRAHGSRAYQEFFLPELRRIERFQQFYHLLGPGGLLPTRADPTPRALALLQRTGERQREVGDELYDAYSAHRLELIGYLHTKRGRPLDAAISVAQKLLDRIVFVAFCEDRGLLPRKVIDRMWHEVPALARVTNPRWQNFLNLFRAVDKGHRELDIETGYNGGLFAHDPDVDNLQLDDNWTDFFRSIGTYDFHDEVHVDVLGHLFEKSVTELEKIRIGGLYDSGVEAESAAPAMPKSAERKRFGIYYTPPEFTGFIVEHTIGALIEERFAALARRHGVAVSEPRPSGSASSEPRPSGSASSEPRPSGSGRADALLAYHRDRLTTLRDLKVCDPACGSGAFLIRAYDYLEEQYTEVIDELAAAGDRTAARLADQIPDLILADNLFGVDLSPEAVEITQLALWIRSARRGHTLANLSQNIVCGNSLVDDPMVHPRAMSWSQTFPGVFDVASAPRGRRVEGEVPSEPAVAANLPVGRPDPNRDREGAAAQRQPAFDCVIGNPPWERLKVQEREFFSLSAPDIAGAVNAADRRRKIAALEKQNPELYALYAAAQQSAERALDYARTSGRYPLTGKGDINSYVLFAELARAIVAPDGRVGLLVPSGIATDTTAKDFFAALVSGHALVLLYDFENKLGIFADVHRSYRFCTLVFTGERGRTGSADFVFMAHRMEDLEFRDRHISLTHRDFALLNPNTRTCPVFRSRRDAELTKAVYRRVPVLIDRNREAGGNPWGIRFLTMFHQTNDAELFRPPEELAKAGLKLHGNRWQLRKRVCLPLYEAKMFRSYDHRLGDVYIDEDNWMNQGQTDEASLVSHQNPEYVAQPRWWVEADVVREKLGEAEPPVLLAFRDITRATDNRTMIAAFLPLAGVVNTAPLIIFTPDTPPRLQCCLLGNLNAFVCDFVARQKTGGIHLNFFIVEQLPILPPDAYDDRCPWNPRQTLERWISDRVLKLTCTANDMLPLAEAADFKEGVHKWKPDDRAQLKAELDAAYFHLYGLSRDDAEYVLSTFTGTARRDLAETGETRTAQLVLSAYDDLAARR